jgi:octaprenyl-diphosphate synthase
LRCSGITVKYGLGNMRIEMRTTSWDFGIQRELRMVDKKLREMVKSNERVLTEASLHVIEAGGKRLRPAVTVLSYMALGGRDVEKIVDIAAGFELIHSATLIHDDINDGGKTRRGRETVYKKYGLHDAIVTGDFLFTRAFRLGGTFDRVVVETTADACVSLAEGEVMENRFRHKSNLNVDTYIKIIERKTAQPIRAGAMVGAYLAKSGPGEIEALGSYGLDLGIAFQIIDDILDFTGDSKKTGKAVGMDLKEGHMTLPSLIAIKESKAAKAAILKIIGQNEPSPGAIKKCADLIRRTPAIDKSKAMADFYGLEALQHLGCLPDNIHSRSLKDIVFRVLERDT